MNGETENIKMNGETENIKTNSEAGNVKMNLKAGKVPLRMRRINFIETDKYEPFIKDLILLLLKKRGFQGVDGECLIAIVNLFKTMLNKSFKHLHGYTELSSRSAPTAVEVLAVTLNAPLRSDVLWKYLKWTERPIIKEPHLIQEKPPVKPFKLNSCPNRVVNENFALPDMPDKHTFSFTPSVNRANTEYAIAREKQSLQRRATANALINFHKRIEKTFSLATFEDKNYELLLPKPKFPSYLAALNPIDQIFDFDHLENCRKTKNGQEQTEAQKEEEVDAPEKSVAEVIPVNEANIEKEAENQKVSFLPSLN